MKRLFFGVPPTPAGLDELARYQEALRKGLGRHRSGRWIPSANWHVTLHFLGSLSTDLLPQLEGIARDAVGVPATSSTLLQPLGDCCLFPARRAARIGALGGPPVEGLLALWGRLGEGLRALGLPVETRAYLPHVTFVRFARPLPFSAEETQALTPSAAIPYGVEKITLFESVLTREGSHYEALAEFLLARPHPP